MLKKDLRLKPFLDCSFLFMQNKFLFYIFEALLIMWKVTINIGELNWSWGTNRQGEVI